MTGVFREEGNSGGIAAAIALSTQSGAVIPTARHEAGGTPQGSTQSIFFLSHRAVIPNEAGGISQSISYIFSF